MNQLVTDGLLNKRKKIIKKRDIKNIINSKKYDLYIARWFCVLSKTYDEMLPTV